MFLREIKKLENNDSTEVPITKILTLILESTNNSTEKYRNNFTYELHR